MSLVFRSRQRVMRLATDRGTGTADVSPSGAAAAMDRLERLHEVGVLSESELAEVKAATLRRIPPD
jgi:hypothetical protein